MLPSRSSRADEESSDVNLEYLRDHPSAALPPSPLSPNSYGRPRAPTPSASLSPNNDLWSPPPEFHSFSPIGALSSPYSSDSPVSSAPSPVTAQPSPPLRPVTDNETSIPQDLSPPNSFARPPKASMHLPDPSQYPDPYPFRPPHHHLTLTPPALSSAGSSSASTRSSAYTSSGSALASGDYGHVHVASGDDDAVGITSDAVVQLLASDANMSPSNRGPQARKPVDQTRWSESYSASIRSRSSSVGNNNGPDTGVPRLQEKPSYDMGWQAVDERDEVGMSEEETDDDPPLSEDDDHEEREEERTSAIVIAEEGRGLIVQGDNVPVVQLHVQSGAFRAA